MQDGLEKAIELINDFLEEDFFKEDSLKERIKNLETFSFLNLNTNREYHNIKKDISVYEIHKYGYYNIVGGEPIGRGKPDDYDDMNITRAIHFVLYHDRLPNIRWEDFKWEFNSPDEIPQEVNYRGDTINTFNTLINEGEYKEFFKDIENGDNLIKKIEDFLYLAFSVGNFMLLPNKKSPKYYNNTLNQWKGVGSDWRDYFDKFLHFMKEPDEIILEYTKVNSEIYDLSNFEKFIDDNYLNAYIGENGMININFAPHIRHWKCDYTKNKEEYAEFINKYIDTATDRIKKRAETICKELEKKLATYDKMKSNR